MAYVFVLFKATTKKMSYELSVITANANANANATLDRHARNHVCDATVTPSYAA